MNNGLYVLTAFVSGWFFAQILKIIIYLISNRGRMGFKKLLVLAVKSGGMPSGHSASFTAMAMAVGLFEGFSSVLFALSFGLALVIVYDAINVRHAVGEQGKWVSRIAGQVGYKGESPRLVEGHTVPEAIAGIWLGMVLGLLVFILVGKIF